MRNIIIVALLIALATLIGCKPKESKPTDSSMNSTEQPKENMEQAPATMEEPAATTQEPASGDAAGSAQ